MIDGRARLSRLLGFLESEPDNVELLLDAAEAALDTDDLGTAEILIDRVQAVTPGGAAGAYLKAMLAMKRSRFGEARDILTALSLREDAPNIRFSLAWCQAMLGDKAAALEELNNETVEQIAAAAMLRMQLLHEAGELDGALELGKGALTRFPDDLGLLSALATLALDVEDVDLARVCASRGGDHPEALAAAGVLDLCDGDPEAAQAHFDRSLAIRGQNPRAWIGRGLSALIRSDATGAAGDLDRGAQQFGDHVGSWIAAGWAYYLAGDMPSAAERFERALALDPNFAECHGALAVIDLAQGDTQSARRRTSIALRLDRNCFSAALAQLLMSSDNPEQSRAILDQAFHTPIGSTGLTMAAYVAGLSRPTIH